LVPGNYRVGIGYDSHRLRPGGPIRLGGVDVPSTVELVGHSDADVLTHAIIDAILGAAALGDIGDHFPPSDETFRNADSLTLLRSAVEIAEATGFKVVNVDATVIAEAPNLGEQKRAMSHRLAEILGVPSGCVSVKASTNEGMGFIGREEGIAVHAVALLAQVGRSENRTEPGEERSG